MKKYIVVFLTFFSLSSAHAGIFEYYLGEETTSNADSSTSADVVESINVEISPALDYIPQKTGGYISDNLYDRYPYDSHADAPYITSGYYVFGELEKTLEDESFRLDKELDYIEDQKEDIKDTLRDIREYNTQYYRELSRELESELQYLQSQEEYLEDLQKEIKDHLSDLRRNSNYRYSSRYYFNGAYHYDSDRYYDRRDYYTRYHDNYYYNDYYGYDSHYYNDYYRDRYYYDYDYFYYDGKRYERLPHWVNPYLEEVKDGRIFIK